MLSDWELFAWAWRGRNGGFVLLNTGVPAPVRERESLSQERDSLVQWSISTIDIVGSKSAA